MFSSIFSLNENDLLGYISKLADTRELAQEIARRVAAGETEFTTEFTVESVYDLDEDDISYIKQHWEDFL